MRQAISDNLTFYKEDIERFMNILKTESKSKKGKLLERKGEYLELCIGYDSNDDSYYFYWSEEQ